MGVVVLVNERPEDRRNPEFNTEASLKEARSRLSLRQVMQQFGHGPAGGGHWKSFTCPHCHKKGKAGVFESKEGGELFKCQSTSCPTWTQVMDEIGYVAFMGSLNRKDAFISYLKMAGAWRERTKYKPPENDGSASVSSSTSKSAPSVEMSSPSDLSGSPEPNGSAVGATVPPDITKPISLDSLPSDPAAEAVDGSTTEASPAQSLVVSGPGEAGGGEVVSQPVSEPVSAPEPTNIIVLPRPEEKKEEEKPALECDGYRSLRAFYALLNLTREDGQELWFKRGMETRTCVALGFKSSPKQNRDILLSFKDKFEMEELVASGLYVAMKRDGRRVKGEFKPNPKYCGWGPVGKKPNSDDWEYGWTRPVLIPYLDDKFQLIGLRPHKSMSESGSLAGTPRLYVPRRVDTAPVEGNPKPPQFKVCVVTESEFKAAALWQRLGEGREDGRRQTIGVCGIPGISFGRHNAVREELEAWLKAVGCRRVKVAFDNEEKGNPALPGYKEDFSKRFDSIIWARFLAADLQRKIHVVGEVCQLPAAWRDEKGKADWDGIIGKWARGEEGVESERVSEPVSAEAADEDAYAAAAMGEVTP